MTATDLRRDLGVYRATTTPALVEVPALSCLMVDGSGDPNTAPAYRDAVATLYAVSYGVRAMAKAAGQDVWKVMPLEGLWWVPGGADHRTVDRAEWRWTMLIVQPRSVDGPRVAQAVEAASARGRAPQAENVRLEVLQEGHAMQVLHQGPYADEWPTIERLHAAITDAGLGFRGKHHEVYLTDPRRSAPERMRTILRQPVEG